MFIKLRELKKLLLINCCTIGYDVNDIALWADCAVSDNCFFKHVIELKGYVIKGYSQHCLAVGCQCLLRPSQ